MHRACRRCIPKRDESNVTGFATLQKAKDSNYRVRTLYRIRCFGQGFDSPYLHQYPSSSVESSNRFLICGSEVRILSGVPFNKGSDIMEPYIGLVFANGWRILEKLNCAQSAELGLGYKNSHWLAVNENCGNLYYFENTVVKRWLNLGISCLAKCKKCKPDCYYSNQNFKTIEKEIDRTELDTTIGTQYGDLTIVGKNVYSSSLFIDHHKRVECACSRCNQTHFLRFDAIKENLYDCF